MADRMHEMEHDHLYTPCKTEAALDAFLDEFGYPDFGSPLLDDRSPNEMITARYKNVSLEDLVAQEIDAFVSILSTFEDMDEKIVKSDNLVHRITHHTIEQYRVHAREIQSWLKTHSPQIK